MLYGIMGNLPQTDERYCWHVEWLYEEDNLPSPQSSDHSNPRTALDQMMQIWNAPKTLVHLSISRRNA